MRRLLPLVALLLFAAPARAEVPTLGGHNVIAVDGVGYFDVRIERDTTPFRASRAEGLHLVWRVAADQPGVLKAIRVRRYGGGGGAWGSASAGMFGLGGGPLPAGDYRIYAASPVPATITIDVEGFTGERHFAIDNRVTGGGGIVPRIATLADGTEVFGSSVWLDTPGWMVFETAAADDGAVVQQEGGCAPIGRAQEPAPEDFGPGCSETEMYARRNQVAHGGRDVPARWNGYGTWGRGVLGAPATRSTQALWIADGPPMTAPVWPADAPAAVAPAPAPAADQQPAAAKRKKARKARKARKQGKQRRAARRRG